MPPEKPNRSRSPSSVHQAPHRRGRPKQKNQHRTTATIAQARDDRGPDARAAALKLLDGCLRHGRALDEHFDAAATGLEDRDRAFARLLIATTLRRLGQIDAVLSQFVEHAPPALTHDVLRISAAQILFVGTPVHAAVATGVDMIKRTPQNKFSGLVNAVLRRVAEKGTAITAAQDAALLNTPAWLWQRWVAHYGESTAHKIASAHLHEAPVDLTLKDEASTEPWATQLKANILPTGTLRLTEPGRIDVLPGFGDGAWWVQDAAAALPARILLAALGVPKGKHVVDLCAAPGGKTMQLAATGCAVTAVDMSARRLSRVHDNLNRVGLQAEIVTGDAMTWRPTALLDAVLLDAPCSSTGTIRRHPDLPYLKTPEDVTRLGQRQRALVKAAAEMLKPGGLLLYSVCSLEPVEGDDVIEALLAEDQTLVREPLPFSALGSDGEFLNPRGDLRTLPYHWSDRGGLDGFYAALLRKCH